jgi:cell division transport system permease protein
MRLGFIGSEVIQGLRRNVTMTLASVFVVALTLTLFGIALIVRTGTRKTEQAYLNEINVSVYLQPSCGTPNAPATNCLTLPEEAKINQTLQQLPQVKGVQFITSQEAEAIFKKEFPNDPDLIKAAPADELPESFVVKLKNPHQFAVIQSAVGLAPGVSQVNDASTTLNKLFAVFRHISYLVLAFAATLLIATVLLIYNAMRVAAFTRRKETGIMRLVGASDLFIQAPFVIEGIVIGVVGGLLATVMLVITRFALHQALNVVLLHNLGTWSTLVSTLTPVWLVAILLPGLASFLTLRRHLRV